MAAAFQPDARAVRVRRHGEGGAHERALALVGEVVVLRPPHHAQPPGRGVRGNQPGVGRTADAACEVVDRCGRQDVALAQQAPFEAAEARREVGRTAAQDGFDLEPAGHGQVGAQPAARTGEGDDLPFLDPQRTPHRQLGGAEPGLQIPAGHGHDRLAQRSEPQPHEGGLEHSRALRVPHQEVGYPHGKSVQGPARGDPQAGAPEPAEILHARHDPGRHHLESAHAGHRGTSGARTASNLTSSPISRSAGSRRRGSKSSIGVQPMICQPPGLSTG